MVIMSVDVGKARTGIAVSDSSETFAFPKTVINEYNEEKLIEKIIEQSKILAAQMIVVGLPKNMNGSEGFKAQECTALAEKLKQRVSVPVNMWDERCTTVSAHTTLNYNNVRGKKRKQVVDAVAAVMILEDYMRYRKSQSNL